jgi:8-oxo-dGTP diphosphatase
MYSPAGVDPKKSSQMTSKIEVVAGLLLDGENVLVAQRKSSDSGAGFWEFPGGKVEDGETLEAALKREIQEELAIDIQVLKFLDSHEVVTPTQKIIQLSLLAAHVKQTEFQLLEHDAAVWVHWSKLDQVHFLPGNRQFLAAVENFFTNP